MTPAAAIHAALDTSIRKASALVGEHESRWSRYVAGRVDPSAAKVQGWVDSLAANGRPLSLYWDVYGCTAVLASP